MGGPAAAPDGAAAARGLHAAAGARGGRPRQVLRQAMQRGERVLLWRRPGGSGAGCVERGQGVRGDCASRVYFNGCASRVCLNGCARVAWGNGICMAASAGDV